MIKYTEYKYHAAALFTVAVWGATFVSTKVLIAHSLTPAEIFLLRFALAYVCIWPLSKGRLRADGWRDEALLAAAGSDKQHILSAQIWLKNIERDFAAFNEVWVQWMPEGYSPARAAVQAEMARPEILVEIMLTAVKA